MKREVKIGNVKIGNGNKIAVQSMTNSNTKKVSETVKQIHALENAGCDIVRCAVYDEECAIALKRIKEQINIPLVADIHFDYKLAVLSIKNGADKIRINPGNIGGKDKIGEVVKAAKDFYVPIRVGVNAGSISKDVLNEYGGPNEHAMVKSAMDNINILRELDFENIVVSIKSSSVPVCVKAYKEIAKKTDYPLHIGVTEAGTYKNAIIKSSIAMGALLLEGIGDTIRVSVTGDPVQEIYAAKDILKSCGIITSGVEIISCPTCARCSLDIEKIANSIENYTRDIDIPIKIAIMGCAVNGPGEAREADVGIAGGRGEGLLFSKGKAIKKVDEFDILRELKLMINEFVKSGQGEA